MSDKENIYESNNWNSVGTPPTYDGEYEILVIFGKNIIPMFGTLSYDTKRKVWVHPEHKGVMDTPSFWREITPTVKRLEKPNV